MTELRKYQLLLLGTVVLFIYVLATEIPERYGELWSAYSELETKNESVRDPEALSAERDQLLARQKELKGLLRTQSGTFEQSRTGTVEFINASATKAPVKLESLIPMKPVTSGHEQVVNFKLSCTGPMHRVGAFLNQLETGPFSLQVNKLEVSREGARAASVKATIEGVVHLAL